MSATTYILIGFKNYIIEDKILYRAAYKTESVSCKWQYRSKRKINKTFKDGAEGYWLVKNGKRKFYLLTKLKRYLKKLN